MLELEILEIEKQTPNTLRWGTQIAEAKLQIYISKWRVPEPWPRKIYADIQKAEASRTLSPQLSKSDARIIAYVEKDEGHKNTLRYQPIGNEETWEIRKLYIPYSLTQNCAQILKITIHWEKPVNF